MSASAMAPRTLALTDLETPFVNAVDASPDRVSADEHDDATDAVDKEVVARHDDAHER
jgi:hypothetical protein